MNFAIQIKKWSYASFKKSILHPFLMLCWLRYAYSMYVYLCVVAFEPDYLHLATWHYKLLMLLTNTNKKFTNFELHIFCVEILNNYTMAANLCRP